MKINKGKTYKILKRNYK